MALLEVYMCVAVFELDTLFGGGSVQTYQSIQVKIRVTGLWRGEREKVASFQINISEQSRKPPLMNWTVPY